MATGFIDYYFHGRATWKETFAWLPHFCIYSGRLIWLENGVRGMAMWTGPGEPIVEVKWMTKKEYTWYMLSA
jgi:hypothetical protein